MKSDQQALVEKMNKRLRRDPVRMNLMRVQWDRTAELLAGYLTHSAKKWKNYEAHMAMEKARYGILEAADRGVPVAHLWIYGMHAVGFPAAPHPKSMKTRKHDGSAQAAAFSAAVPSASDVKYHPKKARHVPVNDDR